ncbi:hypothetical protein H2203_007361 [Taxawa tesnikishii (nom. ined.)]|nr:hypothetical protein H2203_007361 [Dothideales sp. JES 119]
MDHPDNEECGKFQQGRPCKKDMLGCIIQKGHCPHHASANPAGSDALLATATAFRFILKEFQEEMEDLALQYADISPVTLQHIVLRQPCHDIFSAGCPWYPSSSAFLQPFQNVREGINGIDAMRANIRYWWSCKVLPGFDAAADAVDTMYTNISILREQVYATRQDGVSLEQQLVMSLLQQRRTAQQAMQETMRHAMQQAEQQYTSQQQKTVRAVTPTPTFPEYRAPERPRAIPDTPESGALERLKEMIAEVRNQWLRGQAQFASHVPEAPARFTGNSSDPLGPVAVAGVRSFEQTANDALLNRERTRFNSWRPLGIGTSATT